MSITNPVYNPNGMWQIWNIKDIYTGPNGSGQYVPKVGDEVHEIIGDAIKRYIVAAVDSASLLSTFTAVKEVTYEQDTPPADVLFGATSDTYRVYLDDSVTPHRFVVDARLHTHLSTARYCKIFLGTDISNSGTVVSAWYNTSGAYVGENIQLELAATAAYNNNSAIKAVMPGWTSAELPDGQLVTAVIYDIDGVVLTHRTLMVQNTGFVRGTDAYAKAVVGISLESPFLAAANSKIIKYPVNVPINAINLIGVVNFSDGSVTKLAVDGTKFSIGGLSAYAPTIVGQECPLTLKYRLQTGETAYGASNASINHFSEDYTLITTAVDGSYAVQLYCYPVWVSASVGYRLTWFLYDLDRSINYDVTSQVVIDTSVQVFRPTNYGAKQTLSVYLNLRNVNAIYNDFTHVQYVDVVLNNPGTMRPAQGALSLWQVAQQSGQVPMFGQGAKATYYQLSTTSYMVKVNGDFDTFSAWLQAYYVLSKPLYNPSTETNAPTPTHFNLHAGGVRTTYSISQWNAVLTLNQSLLNNDTVYLEFFKRTSTSDLQLSKIGLPLFQVDSVGNYLGSTTSSTTTTSEGLTVVSEAWLKSLAVSVEQLMVTGAITRNSAGAAIAANLNWPDGAAGVYTATTVNGAFVTAYTVTHVLSGVVVTLTRTGITYDADGNVTNVGTITAA